MPFLDEPRMYEDFYLEHMRKTMEWIEEKIRDHRIDPAHRGYHVEIAVEAQWLQQLVAECVAKHQMLMQCQAQLAIAARASMLAPVVFPEDIEKAKT